ncbi:hypothetical protein G6F43_008313 [Rhizopus delemar]|nr:hypothetical protein G6F43_008313 [Rhizopus delemar]
MYGKRSFGDAFTSEVSEKVVSIIAKEVGFEAIQPAALETLSNSLGSYLERLLIKAHLYAELVAGKGRKYLRLVKSSESTIESTPEFLPSDNEDSDEEEEQDSIRPSYVSQHFPTFPSKHSFRQTPIYIKRPDDPQKVRELNSEQSRTVEENLKKLMATENQILRESSGIQVIEDEYMMPIVNYEGFLQRRKRSKQKGTTLNVEGSNEPKINTIQEQVETQELEEGIQEAIVEDQKDE